MNESMSGAAITVQSLSVSKALEKPLSWFLAVALGSVLALDKLGRSLDGTSLERSLEGTKLEQKGLALSGKAMSSSLGSASAMLRSKLD